ncbi:hypothetical protein FW774_17190 [Pedobacter sp. BS3]|uniref:hypothetical protein n=1 Tax=Pedobacter sp. BS3 TaxID=2567937 RepID=UPI0011EBCDF9|nr:hypothetical protein [Pedobacter sp. BS3]TZF81791.1 hypothetical protein FW774_17190 [Pedobacter sp. BS3]
MINLIHIEKAVSNAFKLPLKRFKTEHRYLCYYIAVQYGIRPSVVASYFRKSRANVHYGCGIATDMLSYDKRYKACYTEAKNELDNHLKLSA